MTGFGCAYIPVQQLRILTIDMKVQVIAQLRDKEFLNQLPSKNIKVQGRVFDD